MNRYHRNAVRTVVALCTGVLLLTSVALAQDTPAALPETGAAAASANTANAYATQLDELRALGQIQAVRTAAAPTSANEYASELQRLNDMAAGPGRPSANDYITTLDQLRALAAN